MVLIINQKVAVNRVLSAIRPSNLRSRIKPNLKFARANLTDDCRRFMRHALCLLEAFQLLYLGS